MSDARDRAETRDFIDTFVELGGVSCGCSVAFGLIILGTCAGAALSDKNSQHSAAILAGIAVVVTLMILGLVYVISRKNAKLKLAQAKIEQLSRTESIADEGEKELTPPSPDITP